MAKTTDELFAEATEADYETIAPMVLAASDTEEEFQFRIDEHLRTIAIPEKGVVAGVEGDLNVNIARFTMVRYYHGRDLSKLNIRINYRNANGQVNYYTVSDATISGDSIEFSWEYAADVTQYKGNVQFVVYLFSATNAVLKQKFFTTLGTLEVLEGLEVDSSIPVSEQTDILLHLKKDLSAYAEEVKKSLPADYTAMTEQVSSLKEEINNEVLRTKVGFFNSNYENHDLNNAPINSFYMTLVGADKLEKNHYPTTTIKNGENGLFCVLTLQPTKQDADGITQIVMTRPNITGIKPRIWIRNCIYDTPTATLVGWSEWLPIGTANSNAIMKANNISYNKESIKNVSPFDLNKKYLSRIYEFDVDFDNQTVLNAPFYPFRGTLVVFSPGEPDDYSGDSAVYYGVGTVQMVFKSRSVGTTTVSNYDGAYYIRCYVSGEVGNETWTEWKEYRPYEKEKTTICKNLIQCFENFCVVGDSISGGYTNIGTSETIGTDKSVERGANWPQYMSIDIGRPVLNLGIGGSSAKSWRNGLKSKLEKKQCYFLYLGGNDMAKGYPLGSESDIVSNYESNVDSYYGNYDYMVRYIHTIAPNAIIFCISNTRYDNNNYKKFNVACKYVANLYEFCHYIDINVMVDEFTDFFGKNFNGHFSPIGYNFYGKCIQYAVNEYMYNNPTKFLGIPYTVD